MTILTCHRIRDRQHDIISLDTYHGARRKTLLPDENKTLSHEYSTEIRPDENKEGTYQQRAKSNFAAADRAYGLLYTIDLTRTIDESVISAPK